MLIDFVVASKEEEVVTNVRYEDHKRVCESASVSAVLMCWGLGVVRSGKARLLYITVTLLYLKYIPDNISLFSVFTSFQCTGRRKRWSAWFCVEHCVAG